ncbi:hypothetical protein A5784_17820 [Mycobacterium sp. 852013-50091_SCH5140682]|nr:hypothetical protein A5784_17820 [Mycobacterium sp. 852013-50091_SCH5140682]
MREIQPESRMSPMLANNRPGGSNVGSDAAGGRCQPGDRITPGSRQVSKIVGNPHRPAGILPVAQLSATGRDGAVGTAGSQPLGQLRRRRRVRTSMPYVGPRHRTRPVLRIFASTRPSDAG